MLVMYTKEIPISSNITDGGINNNDVIPFERRFTVTLVGRHLQ